MRCFEILVFFCAHLVCGTSKAEAVRAFLNTRMCERLGTNLTFGDVHRFAELAGYPEKG